MNFRWILATLLIASMMCAGTRTVRDWNARWAFPRLVCSTNARFHADLLQGHKLVVACPKLDDTTPYVEKLADLIGKTLVEKTGTKQGWSKPAPDEHWMNGYVQELGEFYRCMDEGKPSFCDGALGYDTVSAIYSAYLSAERGGQEVAVPRE